MLAMMHHHRWFVLFGLSLIGVGLTSRADDAPKDGKKVAKSEAGAAKPSTAKVEKGPFRIEVKLKGVFEATKMTEVSLRPPEAGTPFIVATAVEPGTVVKKGDVLVTLDPEKLDRTLRDLEAERELADLRFKQLGEELTLLEHGTPLELEASEKLKKQADEDLKYFLETKKAIQEKMANFNAKSTADRLEYAKEELKQLQKMYRHKDLTEETEEIILKRQRNDVEQMEFALERAILARDRALNVEIPRQEQTLRESANRATLALEKAKVSLPLTLSQRRLAFAKAKYERSKAAEHLQRLQRDQESLTVHSPADGVVYYGRCFHGQWSSANEFARKLVPGGMLEPKRVFITIVDPQTLLVRTNIEEKDLSNVTAGATAKVTPTALSEVRLPAKVKSIQSIPMEPGTFESQLELLPADKPSAVVAGMACTIKVVPYNKTDALTVPKISVFYDDEDDKPYVYISRGDKPEKRSVKTGRHSGDRIEIVEGLEVGDAVLLSKP